MEATREFIRDSLNGMVPFATHCGVEVTEVTAEGGRAELTPSVEIENHLGTLHAGALFTLGEAASGAAMSGVFADMILGVIPVAAAAEISFFKPARGRIRAHARVNQNSGGLLDAIRSDGVARFKVDVTLCDEDDLEVARLVVDWHVSNKGKIPENAKTEGR
ncbi:MAG: YiiD C-terminal domain-containing protein [Pseudomonadales bacterium]|nr:YiiD C-terminal domain-containing protein [Pseudomonadales bacterium]